MAASVGIRELRQNLSRYLERVKAGEDLIVTERGEEVARLVPSGSASDPYIALAREFGATIPTGRLEEIAVRLTFPSAPAGTTARFLAEGRSDRR